MESKINWIIPVIIDGYRTLKDKTIRLSVTTNELTPEQQTGLFETLNSFGFLAFKRDEFKTSEIKILDDLKAEYDDATKTPSRRIKSILYLLWQQESEGFSTSEEHYKHHTEKYINHLKNRLE